MDQCRRQELKFDQLSHYFLDFTFFISFNFILQTPSLLRFGQFVLKAVYLCVVFTFLIALYVVLMQVLFECFYFVQVKHFLRIIAVSLFRSQMCAKMRFPTEKTQLLFPEIDAEEKIGS